MSALRTPLYPWHVARKARLVPFGGWDMPVQYAGTLAEHRAVRTAAGLFDISHMGRLTVDGPEALTLVDRLFTNDPAGMKPGQVRYGLVLNEAGGVLDDILVTKWSPEAFELVVNASNREKIVAWAGRLAVGMKATLADRTADLGMLAVQGPQALELCRGLFGGFDPSALRYYFAGKAECLGSPCVVSRTGYTGEDGLEIVLPSAKLTELADELVRRGVTPCGLGARDTLRLEAGMPLYGHELTETTSPLNAGLGWAVKPDKGTFVGRDAVLAAAADKSRPVRVGLVLEGKRAAREGSTVVGPDGSPAGPVTSGSYAPTLDRSVAMGYVPPGLAAVGTRLGVDVRGTVVPAEVVPLPFYKRNK